MAKRLNLEVSTAERLLEGFVEVVGEECGNLNRLALPSNRRGCYVGESDGGYQITPCSIIAFATFIKPAMLAPFM